MKKLLFLIPILLISATPVFAAPEQPTTPVWIVPADAKQGDTVELDALVFNRSDSKTITVSVLFATPSDDIATVTLTLPAGAAKTATTSDWKIPQAETVVTASVIKAVDTSQKVLPEMLGPIGTVTVGTPTKSSFSFGTGNFAIGAKTWFGTMLGIVEPWRVEQAQKYVQLRDNARKDLNVDTVKDITDRFNAPDSPATTQTKQPTASEQAFPLKTYATLILASTLAAILGSSTVFYIAVVCVILLLFRLFIKLFT